MLFELSELTSDSCHLHTLGEYEQEARGDEGLFGGFRPPAAHTTHLGSPAASVRLNKTTMTMTTMATTHKLDPGSTSSRRATPVAGSEGKVTYLSPTKSKGLLSAEARTQVKVTLASSLAQGQLTPGAGVRLGGD